MKFTQYSQTDIVSGAIFQAWEQAVALSLWKDHFTY